MHIKIINTLLTKITKAPQKGYNSSYVLICFYRDRLSTVL